MITSRYSTVLVLTVYPKPYKFSLSESSVDQFPLARTLALNINIMNESNVSRYAEI